MVKALKPWYEIPSHTHFSMKIVPQLYEQEKKKQNGQGIIQGMLCCPHYITAEWEMRSAVLQTRLLYESHQHKLCAGSDGSSRMEARDPKVTFMSPKIMQ